MDLGLKGKYALITGGSHGIGRSTALALARESCNVAICARTRSRIDETISLINSVDVMGITADVTNPADIKKVMEEVKKKWGKLHILVNNVGGGGRWGSEVIENTSEKVWMEVFDKNAMATIRFTREAIPIMRKQKWGRIVTITSIYGREGGGRPWFNMAKAAQTSLMKSLGMSKYLVRDGITFNSVAPGAIMIPDTGWEKQSHEDPNGFKKMLDQDYPLGRLGTSEEVADVITFLCSEKASLINGASIVVDGGQSRSF